MQKKRNILGFSYNRQKIDPRPLLPQLFPSLTLLIAVCVIGVSLFLYQQHNHYLHDGFREDISELDFEMQTLLQEQTSALSLAIKPIAGDPAVQKALREKDANRLLMQWREIFEKMKAENGVTHFYFFDNKRVCLLRVHNPGKKGDVINRFTAQEAEWSRKLSSGIEIGPMGMMTLRVVQPVIIDNELIGYIEMGKEIEDVLKMLHSNPDIDLVMVVKKGLLTRSAWEEGMRLLKRTPQWEMFSDDTLVYSSFEKLPQPLIKYINTKLQSKHVHDEIDEEVHTLGGTYRTALIGIKDVSGKEIGDLFVMKNITNENLEFLDAASIIGVVAAGAVGLILAITYLLLRRTDDGIQNQQRYLFESQERLEQLAHHSRSIAWEVDAQGRYQYISDVVFEVLGFTSEELIGKYFYDLHPLSGRETFKQNALDVFQRKEPFLNLKNRAVSKEGHIVWLMTNGIPLIASDGRLLGYRGNDTDITAWQKAEDAIVESRNLLNTIIDTIPIRVFWKSKSLHYLGCNTLFARDAGLNEPTNVIGKNDYEMGWVEQAKLYRADDRAVMNSGEAKLFYEEEQTTPDGNKIWLSTSKVPLRNGKGDIFGILGIYEDITAQKEMENQLRLNAEMLNEAQRFARMGSWNIDLANNILVWSDEVFRIFELDSKRFKPTYEAFMERVHPEDRDTVNSAYMTSLSSREPYEVTHRLVMEDGRIKWVHESGISDFDEQGRPLRSIGTVQDITERKIAEDEINRLAFFDSLTQLPNRTLFIDRLNQARVQSERNKLFGVLLLIDLDNFKTLNDTLGHGMGDLLLRQSAQRLMQCVREEDSVARLGGDEFVVLITGLGSEEKHAASIGEMIGKKILTELGKGYILDGIAYQSSASIGITLFNGDTFRDDELMKQADLAMYKSKEMGRNSLSFFDPKMETTLKERSLLEEEIRRGIEEEQFTLYFQPQVYKNGSVFGAEALVRWNHPNRGMVSPAEFIPVAEETGLIVPLGEWILKTACIQIREWSTRELCQSLTLSVNVSARQFNQPDFIDQVMRLLAENGADPKRLKLELTESLLVQNIDEVIEKMERLKSYGVRFSLDDFGTGYSSLSYLKRLPLDQLKIDQSFVRDVLSDPNDAIICKSTIALSQSMGLSVIAEGVETDEQLDALSSYGCEAYQGYYFSRPLDIDSFENYLYQSAKGVE